jgi:alpha-methylacyl-CoA racemase
MLLSDLGADVIRVDRKDARPAQPHQVTHRGRRSIALDLKNKDAIELCRLRSCSRAFGPA